MLGLSHLSALPWLGSGILQGGSETRFCVLVLVFVLFCTLVCIICITVRVLLINTSPASLFVFFCSFCAFRTATGGGRTVLHFNCVSQGAAWGRGLPSERGAGGDGDTRECLGSQLELADQPAQYQCFPRRCEDPATARCATAAVSDWL